MINALKDNMIRLSLREIEKIRDSLPEPTHAGDQWHCPAPSVVGFVVEETSPSLKMPPHLVFESVRWYGQYPYYASHYRWVLTTPIEIVI